MEEIAAENLAELEKRYKVVVFILSAQIFSTLVLIVAAWLLSRIRLGQTESFLTLWLVILFVAAGTFVLRRRFFNWERLKNVALLKGVPGSIRLMQLNTIILGLCAEIVIIIGFVISFLDGNFIDMLRAAGIALILFAFNFPRLSVWKKIVWNLEKV
jgi:predicted ABC-type exoprotein transport system permease subunit